MIGTMVDPTVSDKHRASEFSALAKAGWREAPGWFDAAIPQRAEQTQGKNCMI